MADPLIMYPTMAKKQAVDDWVAQYGVNIFRRPEDEVSDVRLQQVIKHPSYVTGFVEDRKLLRELVSMSNDRGAIKQVLQDRIAERIGANPQDYIEPTKPPFPDDYLLGELTQIISSATWPGDTAGMAGLDKAEEAAKKLLGGLKK